jgi:hypothetical protein
LATVKGNRRDPVSKPAPEAVGLEQVMWAKVEEETERLNVLSAKMPQPSEQASD